MSDNSKDEENVPKKVLLSGLKDPIDASHEAIEDEDDLIDTYEDKTDCWSDTTDAEPLTDIKKFQKEWGKRMSKTKDGIPITEERLEQGLSEGWIKKENGDYVLNMDNHPQWEDTLIGKIYDGKKVYGLPTDW